MKRFVIFFAIAFLAVSAGAFADTSELINFSKLVADMPNGQNAATLLDFANQAGASYTAAEKAQMVTSLAIPNWEVVLNSSAQTIMNMADSYTKPVTVNSNAAEFPGQTVMGIRVHFPNEPYNAYAEISPPFQIPAYAPKNAQDTQGTKFDGYGVVKNVGSIKSITATVYGSNFPNGFAIVLQNENFQDRTIYMGNLQFDGWKALKWENPNYISNVRNRSLAPQPLYPYPVPYYTLVGLIIYKSAQQPGGDIITYVHDISMHYDKAELTLTRSINDEAVWGILAAREQARQNAEFQRLGSIQVLRYLEQQKMAK